MLKNYFITAFRNLGRNRTFTAINLFGLALGISAALVLFKVVIFEKSFDKFHSNYENIYRFTKVNKNPNAYEEGAGVPNPLGVTFRQDFPDYGPVARLFYQGNGQVSVRNNSGVMNHFDVESGIAFADNEVFEIFDFDLIVGDPTQAIANPNAIVVSESQAFKLFGAQEGNYDRVIGELIKINNDLELSVTGVFKDQPKNTSLPLTYLIHYEALDGFFDFYAKESWGSTASNAHVYLLKTQNVSVDQVNEALKKYDSSYDEDDLENVVFAIQPMSEVHSSANFDNFGSIEVTPQLLIIPTIVGLFLILTACVNFVNLSTAQAVKRSKEVGIRKVLGGQKKQLVLQFLGETFILTASAILISLGLAELALNNLEAQIGYELSLDLGNDMQLVGYIALILVTVTFLAGIYPSVILSSLQPAMALKSKGQSAMAGKKNLRRGLVVFQFALSQLLVICTLVVISQMDYFQNKELGFRKAGIVTFPLADADPNKLNLIKTELERSANVQYVSYGFSSPRAQSNIGSGFNYAPLKSENSFDAGFKVIDQDYLDLYQIELIAGRNLMKSDTSWKHVLVSEKVIDIMGIQEAEDALGKVIQTGLNGDKTIVGVIKNFNSMSLKEEDQPLILINAPMFYREGAVAFEGTDDDAKAVVSLLNEAWKTHYPDNLFDHSVYSETLLEDYEEEANMMSLFQMFSGIAILIGCLGLYGLIAFMANQKTKEIGVRKVLGASVSQILQIFSKELMALIVIAFVIAAPLGYYVMDQWLQDFYHRIDISAWVFVVAIAFTIIVGGVTTGFRSYKAATNDPVNSLRSE